jgi:hypothetical protein
VQQQAKAARLLPSEIWSRCYRCGAEIPEFEFFEPFKSRLTELMNKHDRIQILKELREESGCEFSVAKQWVSHKTFKLPEATPCPHSGQPLRTAHARQCRFCLRDCHKLNLRYRFVLYQVLVPGSDVTVNRSAIPQEIAPRITSQI